MKKNIFLYVSIVAPIIIFSMFTGQATAAAKQVQLDILYMNHGPMRPTIGKIKNLVANYKGSLQASWYDFDQPEGKAFMKKQKLTGHIPLLLVLDGQSDFSIDGREVLLQGFPTGASPFKQVEGNWSLDDLQSILDQKTR
ncbi:MAG: hypothetical protein JRJ37_04815 [Deltaproteobacteria bacterium]|nr:hypothetical protein [Deltaproteobacteria bacterium]